MFAYRHDILKALIADGARLVVVGHKERLTDLPELRAPKTSEVLKTSEVVPRFLDYRKEIKLLVVPEENVLGLADEPFAGRCMVISVFAKALHQVAGLRPVDASFAKQRVKQQYELRVERLDVEFDKKLDKAFQAAMSKGLWKETAAARDRVEYWAAGVGAYFDAAGQSQRPATREALKAYDPELHALVDVTMAYTGHADWRVKR
jgi:hypothetical protein